MMLPAATVKRFEAKFTKSAEDECWLWRGAIKGNGYGNFHDGTTTRMVHRLSWQIYCGPIPDGLCVCHVCDVRSCVNPAHLFVGTHKDNGRDMAIKERSRTTKLTASDITAIRARRNAGETLSKIGNAYGVSLQAIWVIVQRKTWQHVA